MDARDDNAAGGSADRVRRASRHVMIPLQLQTLRRMLTTRGDLEPPGLDPIARRAVFAGAFIPFELFNQAALALDHALFPFGDVEVRAPVFIIGPPRSGTTFLHRVLEKDRRFTTFRLWQILLPALSVQVPVRRLSRLDRRLGGPVRAGLEAIEGRVFGWADAMHTMRLDRPEEDEGLLFHAFATELLASLWPVPQAFDEYRHFDALPDERRRPLMAFYRRCVQRHLRFEGRDRRLLSKSPVFSTKVRSLAETFPDASFILLVRHPAETVSSLTSLLDSMRRLEATPEARRRDRDLILRFVADCYRGALEALDEMPPGKHVIIRYEDLTAAPRETVQGIYAALGIDLGEFAAALEEEGARAAKYQSRHRHSLADLGYAPGEVEAWAGFVYDRFGYPRG